ncbi:type II toxin-antitoxin system RelE/ParE family toxin [Rhodospirillum sp. A1_3_36]|uniref:type II toxin-antitoxin system RelE/ParE family toxin n=1 Tax=Rhodospirillum sp. A1_3_36 TaxID=3391666 RepID=UPI0039A53DC5
MDVEWLPAARKNLADIADHIAQDNPTAAREMATAILTRVAQLAAHPHQGRPGRVADTRELVVTGTPYLVPYIVQGEVITVLRVLHGKQKWP